MTMIDEYRYYSIRKAVRVRLVIEASRFIGSMSPVTGEREARAYISAVAGEFPDATHHTYAYRIGWGDNLLERCSDAGEPYGTAGPPMLQVIDGEGFSDLVVVATRYFGGVKLGIGGLTRAYRACARACLEAAERILKEPRGRFCLVVQYGELGALIRHIEGSGGEIIAVDYGSEVNLTVAIPLRAAGEVRRVFQELTRGQGAWTALPPEG